MKSTFKKLVLKIFRNTGFIYYTDRLRYFLLRILKFRRLRKFKLNNPGVKLPPAYLIYESFNLDFEKYYLGGRETAKWLVEFLASFTELKCVNILDWGCGPARIARHLPQLLDNSCSVYATDYNQTSVLWNRKNITGINFSFNTTKPPLPYVDNSFDVIYGISVFTHLTEELHYSWFDELVRVSKNKAIIVLTLSGQIFKIKLDKDEAEQFEQGNFVYKGKTRVGHRTFSAYHPEEFVRQLFRNHMVLEHKPGSIKENYLEQDIWVISVCK